MKKGVDIVRAVRKPVAVHAFQFDGARESAIDVYCYYAACRGPQTPLFESLDDLYAAVLKKFAQPAFSYDTKLGLLTITTSNGELELAPGDWLVHSDHHHWATLTDDEFRAEHDIEEG